MKVNEVIRSQELSELCMNVRNMTAIRQYDQCVAMICKAMENFPNAPQPHNLLGILMEKTGNHISAMKHFRAAWALDPTYAPASENLAHYGTFYSSGNVAFDECDCQPSQKIPCKIEYDANGIGRVVRRK